MRYINCKIFVYTYFCCALDCGANYLYITIFVVHCNVVSVAALLSRFVVQQSTVVGYYAVGDPTPYIVSQQRAVYTL